MLVEVTHLLSMSPIWIAVCTCSKKKCMRLVICTRNDYEGNVSLGNTDVRCMNY